MSNEFLMVSPAEAWIRREIRVLWGIVPGWYKWAYRRTIGALWGKFLGLFEYYRDNEGRIRLRRATGRRGTYKWIDRKMVKISGTTTATIDLMPWKECNAGYFDDTLGKHINSKAEYRREMKSQGLVNHEKNLYGKSREAIIKENVERAQAKAKPKIEKAFIEACRREGL